MIFKDSLSDLTIISKEKTKRWLGEIMQGLFWALTIHNKDYVFDNYKFLPFIIT